MIDSGPALTKDNEGYVEHVYPDKYNNPTGGFGHAFLPKSKLPREIWESIFQYDYGLALNDYERFGLDLDDVRKSVVVDILFARGLGNCMKPESKGFFDALRVKDFEKAGAELELWPWYGRVGRRGPRLKKMIQQGSWGSI